jgi:hypothetical protein
MDISSMGVLLEVLSRYARAQRIEHDPKSYSEFVGEMREVLPDFEPSHLREELEHIETLIGEEVCDGCV